MSFAFVCQHNSFIVFKSLRHPTLPHWRQVASGSVGISFVLCLLLGVVGYLSFLEQTQGNILNNFPPTGAAVNAARGLLAFTMVLTYPLECFVTRHCLRSIIER
jgi:sodium-coupled neutral amino acid transporter 11